MFYRACGKVVVEVVVKAIVSGSTLSQLCLHEDFALVTCVNLISLLHIVAIGLVMLSEIFAIRRI